MQLNSLQALGGRYGSKKYQWFYAFKVPVRFRAGVVAEEIERKSRRLNLSLRFFLKKKKLSLNVTLLFCSFDTGIVLVWNDFHIVVQRYSFVYTTLIER